MLITSHPTRVKYLLHSEGDPNPQAYRVVVGSHSTVAVELNEKTFNVSELIMHEDYNEDTIVNDIALVKLSVPIQYSVHVMPVCLDTEDVQKGADCIITGWGSTLS